MVENKMERNVNRKIEKTIRSLSFRLNYLRTYYVHAFKNFEMVL